MSCGNSGGGSQRYEPEVCFGVGGSSPPSGDQDRFAPKYIVGNVPAGDSAVAYSADGFRYIPDTGNGAGIASALGLAAISPGDVWIRPGTYDFNLPDAPALPLAVPADVLVTGAGRTTVLRPPVGDDADCHLFALGAGAELRDMLLLAATSGSESPSDAIVAAQGTMGDPARLTRVDFVTNVALYSGTLGVAQGACVVRDCHFVAGGGIAAAGTSVILVRRTDEPAMLDASGVTVTAFDASGYYQAISVEGGAEVRLANVEASDFVWGGLAFVADDGLGNLGRLIMDRVRLEAHEGGANHSLLLDDIKIARAVNCDFVNPEGSHAVFWEDVIDGSVTSCRIDGDLLSVRTTLVPRGTAWVANSFAAGSVLVFDVDDEVAHNIGP